MKFTGSPRGNSEKFMLDKKYVIPALVWSFVLIFTHSEKVKLTQLEKNDEKEVSKPGPVRKRHVSRKIARYNKLLGIF